jgi:hypothetical protein
VPEHAAVRRLVRAERDMRMAMRVAGKIG